MTIKTNSTNEIEVVKQIYAAINRNDIPAAIRFFDVEVERTEPAGFPMSGAYRGLAVLQEHLIQGRGSWAEGTCEPERYLVAKEKIVVFVHVHVRLKDKQDWIDARFADGFVLQNGKVTQFHTFTTRQDALDWAGINDVDA